MDILRLFTGMMLLLVIAMVTQVVVRADAWRSAVSALHLRWEREQRQAGGNGVTLAQRQAVQTEFEQLVANRPLRMIWLHLALGIGATVFALLLAWNLDDLRWIGLWLVLPLGLVSAAIPGYGWILVNQANMKLAVISTSLYGPAPPRVKVRNIQQAEGEITID